MDPTSQFFSRLRKLAVTVESETAKLLHDFENRGGEDDTENTARAMRAYHEVNCEVGNLKEQIQEQLNQQKAQAKEVSDFIETNTLLQKRLTEDIQALRRHWENYGYTAPQRSNETQCQEPEAKVADENETKSEEEEERSQEAAGGLLSPPTVVSPSVVDGHRTPQLSDFGLSEIQLKRVLAGAYSCSEVPPMPEMNFPQTSLTTPELPPMPITPKCVLRMDEDELQTPQLHDFGISEHTMCLNNDFTMNLFRKNAEKPQRQGQDLSEPPSTFQMERLQSNDELESPEPPVFCTPGLKLKKTNCQSSPPAQEIGEPANLPTTPEVPAFQTPYLNRLTSTKKVHQKSSQQSDGDGSPTFELSSPPHNGATASKRTWAYNMPELSIMGEDDCQLPEMPNLESVLGSVLQSKCSKIIKKTDEEVEKVPKDSNVNRLELGGATQEFSLGTPSVWMDSQEPGTPEMPDLSSVTQDICKLVSKAQFKKASLADVHRHVILEKETNRAIRLSVVSESEFQSLPSYLKQMTLHNLNQAVHSINKFTEEHQGQVTELQIEQLRNITNFGTKTPVYVLCLTELKRLKCVKGASNTSLYKLCTNN
ncbi:spindle and kinetochore-associated protein 3 isoform X2 [Betta splendens]|uniref:Spindle and kinetochore-associated protein 3 isoform X2 n=1 Tax=Betta splendens TaxID=158456 RepID=A0A9W2XI14_BETSP|nr:spindle and kinetochore-associated protein 3 isoform X2 [Betta splendens]